VTATNPSAASFVTVWPDGSNRPTASNLNFAPGQTIPNRVVVKLGPTGKVDLFNAGGNVNLVADVNGWYTSASSTEGGSLFVGVAPARILDTRYGTGGYFTPLGQGSQRAVQVAGKGGVPSVNGSDSPKAVVLNVTATGGSAASYLTCWPDGATWPGTSDLNWTPGITIPNLVVVELGPTGMVDIYNGGGAVDVVMDVVGYLH